VSKSPTRKILEILSQPLYQLYATTNNEWFYKGLNITVLPDVFHPNWFMTSRMLLQYLEDINVSGLRFLELGCGTGTQACRAVQKGAIGYASDITNSSCQNAIANAGQNDIDLKVFQSDIFDQIPKDVDFDLIFVNPPFIEKYPEDEKDFAFCCGEEFEYYDDLFRNLPDRLRSGGKLVIALARSCNCHRIESMANEAGFSFRRVDQRHKFAETNYLFEVTRSSSATQ